MERSDEIERVVARWMVGAAEAEAETVVTLMSRSPGALQIGTVEAEWWAGTEAADLFRRQLTEIDEGMPYRIDHVEAWRKEALAGPLPG